ncbi:peptidoglycan-binding protein [Mesorhizobium marinum]|uniref:peptidoglycan-binding protein n=1 Tax=Mesorhizobium marinum TaxID=3228790 RepID=UPI0034660735
MSSKRSYLDAVNAGRQRRSYASLEQLNRSLETLEQRLERNREETSGHGFESHRRAAYEAPQGAPSRARPQDYRGWPDQTDRQPYQSIASDIERMRREEVGVAAFGKIAGELKGLREELRHQMASSMRREFDDLRKDFQHVNAHGGNAAGKLAQDIERISSAVQALGERGDDRSINMLRTEIEQVKAALHTVAREETVLSVDRRWDDIGRRLDDFENRLAGGGGQPAPSAEIAALTDRIEKIGRAVGELPDSLPLRALEDKVRTLAAALDHFIERQDGRASQTFGQIEERLDEISRAIVAATVASQHQHVDPEPFERIEGRISALAKQIDEVAEDRAGSEMMQHLQALSRRVDELAARSSLPDEAVERLAYQISIIADKVDHTPAMPEVGEIFAGIEQRFDVLSSLFERRQDDALEQGNMLFRELERRLNEVAERIDQRQAQPALDSGLIMKAIDQRFSELAATLGAGRSDGVGDDVIRGLESRLESLSRQIDQSASQFAGIDPDLVRSLEAQVSGLSEHLARPTAPLPEFVDFSPRLREIEKSIAESRDSVLEAARTAAETAARSLAGAQPEAGAVSGLTEELKALEELTRRSDERNSKTFEAIHDTLLKIVDRMGSLERDAAGPVGKLEVKDTPSIDADDIFADADLDSDAGPAPAQRATVERTPAQAAAAAAMAAVSDDNKSDDPGQAPGNKRSLLGGLFRSRKAAKEPQLAGSSVNEAPAAVAPTVDLDTPLDPKFANRPLEPGSGAPDLSAIMKRVRDERSPTARAGEGDAGKSDFIAAARRAAQAAAAEADVKKRKSDVGSPVKALRLGDILKSRRKQVLMVSTALLTALAGLQLGKTLMNDDGESVPVVAAQFDPVPVAATQAAASPTDDPVAARMAGAVDDMSLAGQDDDAGADIEDFDAIDAPQAADMPATAMHDIKVAAIAPVQPIADAAALEPLPSVSIDVPADAGPLPLREAAAAGDARALFEIATRYAEGRGAKPDMAAAAEWYEKSAELGFAPAQYRIGNMYEKGTGVERDLGKARGWYLKAAESGNASAMHNLAVLYAMGAEGQSDNDAAARWFVNAAELGVKDSQFNLGILSAKGVGMKQSLEESYKWFALVAKTGDKDAANKRDEIANALRPEQLERARATAELWKPRPLDPEANTTDVPAEWQESNEKTASIDMPKAIMTVQQILNKSGYQAGNADGVMGDKTRTAIAQFQMDNGMQATGEIDEKLVRVLLARK